LSRTILAGLLGTAAMASTPGGSGFSAKLANMAFMRRSSSKKESQSKSLRGSQSQDAPSAAEGKQSTAGSSVQPMSSLREQRREQQQHAQHESSLKQMSGQQQQQSTSSTRPKAVLSERLAGMKFMQRGRTHQQPSQQQQQQQQTSQQQPSQVQSHKRGYEEAIGQPDTAHAASQWVVRGSSTAAGCVIIHERDPLPSGLCGRMSFGCFNPDTERLQQAAAANADGRQPAAAGCSNAGQGTCDDADDYVSITDINLAEGWGHGSKSLSSLRMQRATKRQRTR
jgi:hypothetical protein